MPSERVSVDVATLERRSKAAGRLKRLLANLYSASFDGPSYLGKARFIDRIKKVEAIACSLDFDLKADVAEAKEKRSGS